MIAKLELVISIVTRDMLRLRWKKGEAFSGKDFYHVCKPYLKNQPELDAL